MTLDELKPFGEWAVKKWLKGLPNDGDYGQPSVITNRGGGDYSIILVFHNNKEGDIK